MLRLTQFFCLPDSVLLFLPHPAGLSMQYLPCLNLPSPERNQNPYWQYPLPYHRRLLRYRLLSLRYRPLLLPFLLQILPDLLYSGHCFFLHRQFLRPFLPGLTLHPYWHLLSLHLLNPYLPGLLRLFSDLHYPVSHLFLPGLPCFQHRFWHFLFHLVLFSHPLLPGLLFPVPDLLFLNPPLPGLLSPEHPFLPGQMQFQHLDLPDSHHFSPGLHFPAVSPLLFGPNHNHSSPGPHPVWSLLHFSPPGLPDLPHLLSSPVLTAPLSPVPAHLLHQLLECCLSLLLKQSSHSSLHLHLIQHLL